MLFPRILIRPDRHASDAFVLVLYSLMDHNHLSILTLFGILIALKYIS